MRDDEGLMLDDTTGSGAHWVERASRRVFIATFVPVLCVYLLTATSRGRGT